MFVWLDYILVVVIGIFCYAGYRRGFILVASDLIGLAISMIIGGIAYAAIWNFAVKHTADTSFVNLLAWAAFLGSYLLYWTHIGRLLAKVPNSVNAQPLNCYAGIAVGAIKGIMYCCLLMMFIVGQLGITAESLDSSYIGSRFLKTGISIREKIIPPTIQAEQTTTEENHP